MKMLIYLAMILSITNFSSQANEACHKSNFITEKFKNIKNLVSLVETIRKTSSKLNNKFIGQNIQQGDDRKVRGKNSPKWLSAVARLNENCSASLVGDTIDSPSRVVTTAYHCLENYYFHGNKTLTLMFMTNNNTEIIRTAKVYSSGNNYDDWAILILDQSISHELITPLIVTKQSAQDLVKDYDAGHITYAGYSSDTDPNLGNYGNNITYDETCDVRSNKGPFSKMKNCFAYGGSSGGPAVLTAQWEDEFDYYFVGHIISSLNRNKGISTYYNTINTHSNNDYIDFLKEAIDDFNN